MFKDFWRNNSGATSIEYVLIAGFLSVMIVAGATAIGSRLSTRFNGLASNLS